jgi:hypothetical protein
MATSASVGDLYRAVGRLGNAENDMSKDLLAPFNRIPDAKKLRDEAHQFMDAAIALLGPKEADMNQALVDTAQHTVAAATLEFERIRNEIAPGYQTSDVYAATKAAIDSVNACVPQ